MSNVPPNMNERTAHVLRDLRTKILRAHWYLCATQKPASRFEIGVGRWMERALLLYMQANPANPMRCKTLYGLPFVVLAHLRGRKMVVLEIDDGPVKMRREMQQGRNT